MSGERSEEMQIYKTPPLLINSLIYPAFLIVLSIVMVAVILAYVIPQFALFFRDLGQELPFATRLLMSISAWAQASWIWVVTGFFVFCFVFISLHEIVQRTKRKVQRLKNFIYLCSMFFVLYSI